MLLPKTGATITFPFCCSLLGIILLVLLPGISPTNPPPGSSSFLIEPWYENLNHYGPLADEGWSFRPMRLVDDFTYRLDGLRYDADQPFMFVSDTPILSGGAVPPLGTHNWKQGKLGMRSISQVQPGGGPGYITNDGVYNFTLRTAGHPSAPNTLTLASRNTRPSVYIETLKSVTLSPTVTLLIRFSEPVLSFDPSLIVATNAEVDASSLVNAGPQDDGTHVFTVVSTILKPGVSTFSLSSGASSSVSSPSTTTSAAKTWSVLYTLSAGHAGAHFGPLLSLQSGAWHVSAMHANFVPSLNAVLLTGFERRDGQTCAGGNAPGGRRAFGISFLLSAGDLADADPSGAGVVDVTPIDEDAEIVMPEPIEGRAKQPKGGVYDGVPVDGDVVYCAGHTTLPDGKIFFVGGARYANISSPFEVEWGLDYARLFDPATRTFKAVRSETTNDLYRMPLGIAWYPTAGRLPDGRVLVTGGFTAFGTPECTGEDCANPQINIFDYGLYVREEGRVDPWRVLLDAAHGDHVIDPGVREYTRVFVLPSAVSCGGLPRQVLLMGRSGAVVLANTDETTPMDNVLCLPPGGMRPSGCENRGSEQSSAVPLLLRGGELMIVGGCDASTQQRIDLYNVQSDSWRSVDTGIRRQVPATILLPDGNVLILSGENPDVNQIRYSENDASSDPRYPQTFDPETLDVMTETSAREDTFRGYHNFAALLGDGSIMLGGGFNQFGDVGCENSNARLFFPSYLYRGPRPAFSPDFVDSVLKATYLVVSPGQQELRLKLDASAGVALHKTRGAALLAVQDFTHSYGENQRYVALTVLSSDADFVVVSLPPSPVLFDGIYQLFLLSDVGTPSLGLPVKVATTPNAIDDNVDLWGVGTARFALAVAFGGLGVVLLVAAIAKSVTLLRRAESDERKRRWSTDAKSPLHHPDSEGCESLDDACPQCDSQRPGIEIHATK